MGRVGQQAIATMLVLAVATVSYVWWLRPGVEHRWATNANTPPLAPAGGKVASRWESTGLLGGQPLPRILDSSNHCPAWIQEYAVFHKTHRTGSTTKYLVYSAEGTVGGLGDRLHGALFTIRLAHALGRIALIKWQHPFGIEHFFEPARDINWSTAGIDVQRGHTLSFIDDTVGGWQAPQLTDGSLQQLNGTFVTIVTNIPFNRPCTACQPVGGIWTQQGACFWQAVFKPREHILQQAEEQLLMIYSTPLPPYVAIHLRLGGLTGEEGAPGPERGKDPLHNVLAAVRCAGQLAKNNSISVMQTPYLVITDHHALRQLVQQHALLDFVSPSGLPVHLDRAQGESVEAHASTVVDMVLLAWSHCLVTSRSGFSEHAWLYGGGKTCRVQFTDCL